jgi:hypothetical protein
LLGGTKHGKGGEKRIWGHFRYHTVYFTMGESKVKIFQKGIIGLMTEPTRGETLKGYEELARGYQRIVCRALVALNNSDALLTDMVQLLNGNGHDRGETQ